MLLSQIANEKDASLNYMERLVNTGSKSGFSSIHTSSDATNPFTSTGYAVKAFVPYSAYKIKRYGVIPPFCDLLKNNEFIYIHPDWEEVSGSDLNKYGNLYDSIDVIPTSSVRTVRIPNQNYYIKLCYPGKIGRLERDLKYHHLISAIEVTEYLSHLKTKNCSSYFSFMPEIGGKLYEESVSLGYVIREVFPDDYDLYLIPAFSLFSPDINEPDDPLLINQILEHHINKYTFLLNSICIPLVDIFFDCAFKEGLIPEMHSQNILIAFDKEFSVKKIILRDFESVDKDTIIRKRLGLSSFKSYPYKCIAEDSEDYLIRHSFMYDYKLCEYLIDPLIEVSILTSEEKSILKEKIKKHAELKIQDWGMPFFPLNGCWYKYPNTEIDRSTANRPYIPFEHPQYR